MEVLKLKPKSEPIDCSITVPGSKSVSNRALICAALSEKAPKLENISPSDDTRLLAMALWKLQASKKDELIVIDAGPAGTVMRFLIPYCAFTKEGITNLVGSKRMHERPIGDLVVAMQQLGANIEYLGTQGCPPLKISGQQLAAEKIEIEIDGSTSSQFVTAAMLTLPFCASEVDIKIKGSIASRSYLDITMQMLEKFQITSEMIDNRISLKKVEGEYPEQIWIEPDASGATYFWGAAAVSGGKIRVGGFEQDSSQADTKFTNVLHQMGCELTTGLDQAEKKWFEIVGPAKLNAIEVDMSLMPDAIQTLAVVASFAVGVTKISGIETLRVKETDRVAAILAELEKVGIKAWENDGSLFIEGGAPQSAKIATYHDHRMAMAFSLLAAGGVEVEIEQPKVVSKSFPSFWHLALNFVQE